ncbi:MAG: hypothetical protein Q8Q09_02040 [Deltaproteobacteria bacterium]|nr:hypothetical protein [Deltaproteobacteria bacterium]
MMIRQIFRVSFLASILAACGPGTMATDSGSATDSAADSGGGMCAANNQCAAFSCACHVSVGVLANVQVCRAGMCLGMFDACQEACSRVTVFDSGMPPADSGSGTDAGNAGDARTDTGPVPGDAGGEPAPCMSGDGTCTACQSACDTVHRQCPNATQRTECRARCTTLAAPIAQTFTTCVSVGAPGGCAPLNNCWTGFR